MLAFDPQGLGIRGAQHVLAGRGLHAEAAAEFEGDVEIDPGAAASYVALGNARAVSGRDADAAGAYELAIEAAGRIDFRATGAASGRRGQQVQPPEVQARRRFGAPWTGLRAVEGGRLDTALARYREAAELDPGSAGAHAGLAGALSRSGLYEEAIPAYRRAAELDPAAAAVHAGLARALYTVGLIRDARQAHERAVDLGYGEAKWGRYDPYDWGV